MAVIYYTVYQGEFCNKSGETILIEFKGKSDTELDPPIPKEIIFAGEDSSPVVISTKEDGDYKLNPINGSECTLNLKADGDFELSSLYTSDERQWQVVISGAWNWIGWLIPDSCQEPFESKPYDVTVRATDSLGTLSDIPFEEGPYAKYRGWLDDLSVLRLALAKTGLSLSLLVGINTYESQMNQSLDPLGQTYINLARFIDLDGNAFSCQEVIRSVLARWSARLQQFNGIWQIVNVLELSRGTVPARIFDSSGSLIQSITIGNSITAGGQNREIQPVGYSSLAKAFLSSTAYYQYGYSTNQLYNSDFNIWTTPNLLPDGWVKVGGVTAYTGTRVENPLDHYIVIVSNNGDSNRVQSTFPVQIRATEGVNISFDLYAPTAANTASKNRIIYLSTLIEDTVNGQWYTANGWQNSFAYYVISYNAHDLQNQISVNFNITPRSEDYKITIGFQAVGRADPADGEYQTSINNVSMRPSVNSWQTKPPLGLFTRLTQTAAQTYKKDPILLLHCDDKIDQRISQISIGSPVPDPIPPVSWTRAGIVEERPLLYIVANSELRLHSRPYKLFQADFIGFGQVDVNTLLTIDLIEGNFIFLSGDFNLKTDVHTLRFAQTIIDDVTLLEDTREDYGTETDKNGTSVGSPGGIGSLPGGSTVNLEGYAKTTDIPIKATASEVAAGTDDSKFITSFKLLGWWTNIKAAAQAITGIWTAPTASPGTNTDQIATTSFVTNGLSGKLNSVSSVTAVDQIYAKRSVGTQDMLSFDKSALVISDSSIPSSKSVADYVDILKLKYGVGITAPSSSTDTGVKYESRIVGGFLYICVDTNTWIRIPITDTF